MNRTVSMVLGLMVAGPALQAAIDFEKQVLPIIEKHCISCHKAPYEENGRIKKPKGGLRLDSAAHIAAGGENGKVIVPGNPDKSTFYSLTLLPSDDADVMPQKGDLLSKREIDTIGQWIKEGAKFGKWKGNHTGPVITTAKGNSDEKPSPLDLIAKGISRPNPAQISAAARKSKARIIPVSASNPLLDVSYPTAAADITNREMVDLAPLKTYITRLDLSKTGISDVGLKHFSLARNLTHLDLSQTRITDAGVAQLRSLPHLTYLNLYGTQVSDRCIDHLSRFKNLRSVYVWQSKISQEGIQKLKKKLPGAEIIGGSFLAAPPPEERASPPGDRRNRVKPAETASRKNFSAGSCCAKAVAKGGKCKHPCCMRASRKSEICTKCNK